MNDQKILREPLTERDMLDWLKDGQASLPPADLTWDDGFLEGLQLGRQRRIDAVIVATKGQHQQRFLVEVKKVSTPSMVEGAALQVQWLTSELGLGLEPLVMVPYLSEERLNRLEELHVSGLDLCGNGVLIGESFYLRRTGQPNRFRESRPLRNIFRGNSSIFTRCFLLHHEFPSLTALQNYARQRSDITGTGCKAILALGTGSKVARALEQELIVVREETTLRLHDAERLMAGLLREFRLSTGHRLVGKTGMTVPKIWSVLRSDVALGMSSTATGVGSAVKYGLLSGSDIMSIYVSDLDLAERLLEVERTKVFPNIELIEEKDEVVYWDGRAGDRTWASPVQTWLEMASAGPRERDASQMLRESFLAGKGESL